MSTSFGLLGPLRVHGPAGARQIRGTRQRTILAGLLISRSAMSCAALAHLLRGDGHEIPPATVHSYVARLRSCLGPGLAERLTTTPAGYRLAADDTEIDYRVAQRRHGAMMRAARERRWAAAHAEAQAVLALWRGAPLCDVDAPELAAEFAASFDELHTSAREMAAIIEIELGHHSSAISRTRTLLHAQPYRERAQMALLRALALEGRFAEGLYAYQSCRSALVEALGIEPSPRLARSYDHLLNGRVPPLDDLLATR